MTISRNNQVAFSFLLGSDGQRSEARVLEYLSVEASLSLPIDSGYEGYARSQCLRGRAELAA
jgi:hypothetical protein